MSGTIFPLTTPTSGATIRIVYSDLNSDANAANNYEILYNVYAITNHIANIVFTNYNEVDFEPTFGSNLPSRLFQLPTAYTRWIINNSLTTAFLKWETDVILNRKATTITQTTDGTGYIINLNIGIVSLDVSNIQLNLQPIG